jgi:hypothetical protein
MAGRWSSLRAGRLNPEETSWYSFLLKAESNPGLEGLGKLKNSPQSGLEPATFRLVAQCRNQSRYRVPPNITDIKNKLQLKCISKLENF